MGFIEIFLTALGLSMDACATSICKGLSMKKYNIKKGLIIGLYFGIFQGLMPVIGYLLGTSFENFITKIDHWVAFVLLSTIGAKMIFDAFSNDKDSTNDSVDFKTMLPLAVATSIDALAIGITLAFLKVNIILSAIIIGITTFIMSFLGSKLGNKFGSKYEKKAQILGGIILIFLGIKILLEHLSII